MSGAKLSDMGATVQVVWCNKRGSYKPGRCLMARMALQRR